MNTKNSPLRISEIYRSIHAVMRIHHHGAGLVVLVGALFVLSVLGALNPYVHTRAFKLGEVVDDDIVAHHTFQVRDPHATELRRQQAISQQPIVFDLSAAEISSLRHRVLEILKTINESDLSGGPDQLAAELPALTGVPVEPGVLQQWLLPSVQQYILANALPWFESRLHEGVVSDARLALPAKSGILVRDMDTRAETLYSDVSSINDIPSLLAFFTQRLRTADTLSAAARRSVYMLFAPLLMPTLTRNQEATLALARSAAETVVPVEHIIRKGDVVVYQGETITREKQVKLQALFQKRGDILQSRAVAGIFTISLILSVGLFLAPSGRPGTPLRRKDFLFISLMLIGFGLGAKNWYFFATKLVQPQDIPLVVYFFPVAGAAGLAVLIFSARRYCVTGLLLALFCTAMLKGGLPLFLFFFLSAMLNTWLVIRAQSRQDMVLSFFPLALGLMVIAAGCGWLEGFRGGETFLWLAGIVTLSAFTSIVILFAASPIIEMAFGYTTRFRLMELMNLEQPLLQELMVSIPGTYHHSLVVANMVEAGAKTVGANGLLCKVSALYHDVGKLAYPDYYIENQFQGPNRHDRLAPNMSALILQSHVKKGIEMAQQHRVGDEIVDIIRQHHGTGLIKYFYSKAKDLGENPRVEDYCYPGPRPQTREAAIVMLADAVEASSRTLSDPTPARIQTHVNTIMKNIFADGQLDESELTFKDLHKLSECFARILTGLFHQRIAYPEVSKEKKLEFAPSASAPTPPPLPLPHTGPVSPPMTPPVVPPSTVTT